ncbi:PilZ domain-containing protein [Novosphingobium sp. JCM 18896]|uniref:PilZ domain-containing protein n=1 Tax=Novosphingobium sp. JCM 18896 TaxID=2989731 RepID=UPI0022238A9C|nr:PilZ domain-containing protein [Novosphingobium sp. JCM 18896]MCW1430751.1 PilZ domain-containing protein [Novosphingobium sp. JCM 18896]
MSNSSASSPFDNLPFGERRREGRASLAASGMLIVSGDERACRIRNLSPHGLRADGPTLPRPGQRVLIEIPGLSRVPAVAIWQIDGGCGLRFEDRQDVGPALVGTAPSAR